MTELAEDLLQRLDADDDGEDGEGDSSPKNAFDSEESLELLETLRGWLAEEKDAQRFNRFQQALDADFYDHLQWRAEDAAILRSRGQLPLVFNRIKLAVDWTLGTERRTRIDWKVLPREADDEAGATVKTKVLKYVSDANRATLVRSQAFADAVKVGVGWIDHGVSLDPERETISIAWESWRNVWTDSKAHALDGSDRRYTFRQRQIDRDIALMLWPQRASLIRNSDGTDEESQSDVASNWYLGSNLAEESPDMDGSADFDRYTGGNFGSADRSRRKRVLITEGWFKVPTERTVLRGTLFDGADYDKENAEHVAAVTDGSSQVVKTFSLRVHYAIWCSAGLLALGVTPYRHNRIPLTPMFCYRRDRDGMPYGMIRGMRDAQEDLNKRRSKALFMLSSQRVLFDQGAFEDDDEAREELARPDAFQAIRGNKTVRVEQPDAGHVQAQMGLAHDDMAHMEAASGVTNEMLALQSNAVSGRAIQARQSQGMATTAPIFDNARIAAEESGQITLSLTEQYYTDARTFRIIGERGKAEFLRVNQPQPTAGGGIEYLNDITRSQADFVIDEIDFRETQRQAMFEELMEMIGKLPGEIAIQLLDIAIDMSDVPNKREFLQRIRSITGQADPNEEMTPEQRAAAEQKQLKAQQAEEIQARLAMGQIAKIEADVAKTLADGKRIDAQAIQMRMAAIMQSLQSGQMVAAAPAIAPAADSLLADAGLGAPDLTQAAPNAQPTQPTQTEQPMPSLPLPAALADPAFPPGA